MDDHGCDQKISWGFFFPPNGHLPTGLECHNYRVLAKVFKSTEAMCQVIKMINEKNMYIILILIP